jgi:hypothetical protein
MLELWYYRREVIGFSCASSDCHLLKSSTQVKDRNIAVGNGFTNFHLQSSERTHFSLTIRRYDRSGLAHQAFRHPTSYYIILLSANRIHMSTCEWRVQVMRDGTDDIGYL